MGNIRSKKKSLQSVKYTDIYSTPYETPTTYGLYTKYESFDIQEKKRMYRYWKKLEKDRRKHEDNFDYMDMVIMGIV